MYESQAKTADQPHQAKKRSSPANWMSMVRMLVLVEFKPGGNNHEQDGQHETQDIHLVQIALTAETGEPMQLASHRSAAGGSRERGLSPYSWSSMCPAELNRHGKSLVPSWVRGNWPCGDSLSWLRCSAHAV